MKMMNSRYFAAVLLSSSALVLAIPDSSRAEGTNGGISHAAIGPDGKIYVAGGFTAMCGEIHNHIARFSAGGAIDSSFTASAPGFGTAFGFFSNGSFLLAAGGEIQSFSSAGIVNSSYPLISGSRTLMMEADGSFYTSFGKYAANGTLLFAHAHPPSGPDLKAMAKQPDGKLLFGGGFGDQNRRLYRLNANGILDNSFTIPVGMFGGTVFGISVQTDEKIIVSGADFALLPTVFRLDSDGSLDNTFTAETSFFGPVHCLADGSTLISNNSNATQITFGPTGRFVTAGSLVRLTSTGARHPIQPTLDPAFILGPLSSIGVGVYTPLTIIPLPPDTDHDGIPDQFESGTGVFISAQNTGTSPTNADSDGDGLKDGAEVNIHHSDPNIADTDGDGFTDGFEVTTGFNPISAQSTPETLSTLRPAREFRFNAAAGVSYRIEGSPDTQNWTTLETNITGSGGVITRFYVEESLGPRYFLRVRRN